MKGNPDLGIPPGVCRAIQAWGRLDTGNIEYQGPQFSNPASFMAASFPNLDGGDFDFINDFVSKQRAERAHFYASTPKPLASLCAPVRHNVPKPRPFDRDSLRLGQYNPKSVRRIGRLQHVTSQLGRHCAVSGLAGTQPDDHAQRREETFGAFSRFHWGRRSKRTGADRAGGVDLYLRADLFPLSTSHWRFEPIFSAVF